MAGIPWRFWSCTLGPVATQLGVNLDKCDAVSSSLTSARGNMKAQSINHRKGIVYLTNSFLNICSADTKDLMSKEIII